MSSLYIYFSGSPDAPSKLIDVELSPIDTLGAPMSPMAAKSSLDINASITVVTIPLLACSGPSQCECRTQHPTALPFMTARAESGSSGSNAAESQVRRKASERRHHLNGCYLHQNM